MQSKHHRSLPTHSTPKTSAAISTQPSPWPPPFRRTWKIVRSEIALDVEPPTSNDGACTIMSLPNTTIAGIGQLSSTRRYALSPHEVACVAWLDWRGHHAKLSCIYNPVTDQYSRFLIDKASIDPPVRSWYVDIRFYQGLKRAGWRVRDENGEWYMVLNLELDEGWGMRRGKAYGKLMRNGIRDEDVVMTSEEGADLGCLVGLKTVEEQTAMVERAREMMRLEGALRQVRERLETVDRDVQQNAEEEVDEDGEHESKMDDLEEIALSGKEHIGEVQEEEGNNNKGEGNNKDGRVEFRFPAANRTRLLNRGYRL